MQGFIPHLKKSNTGSVSMGEDLVTRFILKYGRLPTERDPDYLELLRMTKFRVIERPDVAPFKCANCLSAKEGDRQYVDFGAYVDWYGTILFCTLCLNEIGMHAGLFKAYEIQILKLEETISSLRAAQVTAEELKSVVLHTFEEVKEYFDNLPASGSESAINSNAGVGTDQESNYTDADKPDSAAQGTESKPVKSTAKSGSKNLPSLADLLNT